MLGVERLERRDVPAALSIADVTVREGPASLGVLDPSGAASVGINGIRTIVFDKGPGDPHFGDLFVTGKLSNSVARFEWATQTYQPFVSPGSGGLVEPRGLAVGPDGNVYVTDPSQNIVFRYDGATGAPLPAAGQSGAVFIPAGSGGVLRAINAAFGSDGNIYVASGSTDQILEYQGPAGPSPGAFMRLFVSVTVGSSVNYLTFGPDGNLYVSLINAAENPATSYGQVNRYDGVTGAPIGTGVFVARGSGGLVQPRAIVFDDQGTNLYVVEDLTGNGYVSQLPGPMGQVLRFQGPNGQNPGAYVEAYITGGQAGLSAAQALALDSTGNMYVGGWDNANVIRFAPASQAVFVVTLNSPSASEVRVDYATANGTAIAGSDYTVVSGTLVFAPGETTKTVVVPILDDLAGEPTETFRVNLSSAVNATIADGQGVGTVLDNETKFYVVDSGTVKTYEYGSGGSSEEISVPQMSTNTAPRGAASTATGDKVWVVDANKTVYVYNPSGVLLGSWAAGGLNAQAQVEGIATNGTDVWLLDNKQDKVFKYTGAASRLSGSQNAASSFNLNNSNSNGKGIVTDGASLWVVDDGTSNKVFKYTVAGSLLGSWTIDAANASPTGLTINPASVSDIWIVDNGTDRVYQYMAAAGRTSGSQSASATFALAAGNTNPQDIADPPAPDMLPMPASNAHPLNLPSPPVIQTTAPGGVLIAPALSSLADRDAVFATLVREPLRGPGGAWINLTSGPALTPHPGIPTLEASIAPGGQAPKGQPAPHHRQDSLRLRSGNAPAGPQDDARADEEGQASEAETGILSTTPAGDEPGE